MTYCPIMSSLKGKKGRWGLENVWEGELRWGLGKTPPRPEASPPREGGSPPGTGGRKGGDVRWEHTRGARESVRVRGDGIRGVSRA